MGRDDVVMEVMKAPKRRVDNMVTHLHDSVHQLLMHTRVSEDVSMRFMKTLWVSRGQEIGLVLSGSSFVGIGMYINLPIVGTGILRWFNGSKLIRTEKQLLTEKELDL